jgi:hypothetical protein
MTRNCDEHVDRVPKPTTTDSHDPERAGSEKKKADDGTATFPPRSNLVALVDPPEMQTPTPAMTRQVWAILTN